MGNQTTSQLRRILLAAIAVLGGLGVSAWLGGSMPVSSAAQSQMLSVDGRVIASAPVAHQAISTEVAGAVLTQTFHLHAGWNSIYLEVEPINDSPLVNVGTTEQPIMAPEQSSIEAVFAALSCDDCLQSVWTWNIPLTTMDYIVDPAEGLWDAPGWKRYFPDTSVDENGVSRAFLTDLFDLHVNTGYLVQLRKGAGAVTLTVRGRPRVEHHHWLPDSYNLAGFPIDPDASPAPTVATFFQNLSAGPSPVREVRSLQSDGAWSEPLAAGAPLAYGKAYLVYYDNSDILNYTAPLDIISAVGDSLDFTPGFLGSKQSLRVENRSTQAISVEVQLLGQTAPAVALQYDSDPESSMDPLLPLWPTPATHALAAGKPALLSFISAANQQASDGEALLAIRAPDLGARWLIPVTAKAGDLAGLWIGEVVVNDVSEGRLGGTNVDNGELTVALRPRDLSGLQGSAQWVEARAGNSASVALTATLALPAPEDIQPLAPISATTPYVAGYVFVDSNQNGQRDRDERGLPGVSIVLGGISAQTDENGLYVFEALTPGDFAIELSGTPAGYTSDFPVLLPQTTTITSNALPSSVTLDAGGISALAPEAYRRQVLQAPYTLPQYDADDNRVEPRLNFGLAPIYDVSLWTGQCSDRLEKRRDLPPMVNGVLLTTIDSAALTPGPVVDDLLLGSPSYVLYIEKQGAGGAAGQGIACGELVVGAPTHFANGNGSEFRFRVLLRVDENGGAELLPDYVLNEKQRVSSVNFSMTEPIAANGAKFGDTTGLLDFSILIGPNDPLNPYKHKYHPDHDNLDQKFNAIDFDSVSPYLWESYEVRRRIQLELTQLPPVNGANATVAANLDWGGGVWGGRYKETIEGIHINDITVKGYFIIRHALTLSDLTPQAYDQAGGG